MRKPSQPPANKGLLRSGLIVGMMTLISRILGMLRDILVARFLGAGSGADAFFVAFRIPNLFRRLFAEGAFNQAFVPVLSSYAMKNNPSETRRLLNAASGVLIFILLIVTIIAILAAPLLVWVFAPGFAQDAGKISLTISMLRITFPYLFFISLTAFCSAILNSWNQFAIPALTPIFLNLAMIGALLWLSPYFAMPAMGLAWGVFIAGAIQLAFQLPFLQRYHLVPLPWPDFNHPGVRRIIKLMAPALFGVSVAQINMLINTILASFLVSGSISWLYYTDRLVELPLGIFGVAIGTVILPALSRHHNQQSQTQFAKTLDWALRMILLVSLPAAMSLFLLAKPLLITLFQYGAMTEHDINMTARSLMALAFGLIAYMLIKVLAPGFYARQDTTTPVRIGIISMVCNMLFNLIFIWPLAHAGLALSTALAAFVNAGLLLRALKSQRVLIWQAGWCRFLWQVLSGCLLLAMLLYWIVPAPQFWFGLSLIHRFALMVLIIFAGLVVYFGWLYVWGVRPSQLRMRD